LKKWKGPAGKVNGLALRKQDVYGNGNFWAPQVFKYHNKFYMAYVADQHIAIAESNSPLGPFTQKVKKPLITAVQTIDSYVFIDSDGKKYLYHVRLQNGNRIYVVQLNDDFSAVKPNTLTSCINAVEHPQVWENVANAAWSVTEDPTVLKHNGKYYLFYSANDYRNINYAVGYAVADSPFGPWKKYSGNPILNRYLVGKNGTGGGDFFQNAATGQYYYVFHTHYSNVKVSPRRTAIIKGRFVPGNDSTDKMVFNKNSFRYLKKY
jgi:beta-xylosidase